MKRVIIAAAVLLLVPLLILLDQSYVGSATGELSGTLARAESARKKDDLPAARREVADFTALWDKKSRVLATFIRHAELDPVNQKSARLMPELEKSDGEFYADCEEMRKQLEHIRESEAVSLDNVF